jgi:hypothetical protein
MDLLACTQHKSAPSAAGPWRMHLRLLGTRTAVRVDLMVVSAVRWKRPRQMAPRSPASTHSTRKACERRRYSRRRGPRRRFLQLCGTH